MASACAHAGEQKHASGTWLRALDAAGGERLHKCPDPPGTAPGCSPLGGRQNHPRGAAASAHETPVIGETEH